MPLYLNTRGRQTLGIGQSILPCEIDCPARPDVGEAKNKTEYGVALDDCSG